MSDTRLKETSDWLNAKRLHQSGATFGSGWEEASMPDWLLQQSFQQVNDWYHQGVVTQAGWEAFAHVWATATPRFESFADPYLAEPTDPEVIELVSILRQALEHR